MEVVDLILWYKRHGERILLAVTNLGKKNLILGYTWLREHNPEIDWETREVKLSRCPRRCLECRDEIRAEKVVPNRPRRRTKVSRATGFAMRHCSLRYEGPAASYQRPLIFREKVVRKVRMRMQMMKRSGQMSQN